jgi:RNA polymerase sigma-70 factor, ECF subfamily
MTANTPTQRDLYEQASSELGPALERLARSYELDDHEREDLLQEIHLALWRSLEGFDGRCSLRTWVYRVAHNVGASHVLKQRRRRPESLVTLEALEGKRSDSDTEASVDREMTLGRLYAVIHQLHPIDRQLFLLYLEGVDAASIGEITGLSASNVATKVHRTKKIIIGRLGRGGAQ